MKTTNSAVKKLSIMLKAKRGIIADSPELLERAAPGARLEASEV
jgi:hypothetical protein